MRCTRQNECIGTQLHQLIELLGDLLIAADDAVGLSAAQQGEA
jgi:hypothetical protein